VKFSPFLRYETPTDPLIFPNRTFCYWWQISFDSAKNYICVESYSMGLKLFCFTGLLFLSFESTYRALRLQYLKKNLRIANRKRSTRETFFDRSVWTNIFTKANAPFFSPELQKNLTFLL